MFRKSLLCLENEHAMTAKVFGHVCSVIDTHVHIVSSVTSFGNEALRNHMLIYVTQSSYTINTINTIKLYVPVNHAFVLCGGKRHNHGPRHRMNLPTKGENRFRLGFHPSNFVPCE